MNTHVTTRSRTHSVSFTITVLVLSVLLMSCEDNPVITPPEENTVLDYLNADGNFTTLTALIDEVGFGSLLSNNTSTLFAPTDGAFATLDDAFLDGLSLDQKRALVRYHLLVGSVSINGDSYDEVWTTRNGDEIFITVQSGAGTVNGSATVSRKNSSVDNGMVHHIDGVLVPDVLGTVLQSVRKRYALSGVYEQIAALNLTELLENEEGVTFTVPPPVVFEDVEDWLERSLTEEEEAEIWMYNMIPQDIAGLHAGTQATFPTAMGDSVYVTVDQNGIYAFNTFEAVGSDPANIVRSRNGSFHQIYSLLVPDKYQGILTLMDKRYYLTRVRVAFATARMTGRMYNVEDNADEQFTVFIPRNDAQGIDALPEDEESLANVLKYHVLLEKIKLDELQHNQTYTTWQGEEITVTRSGDTIILNGEAVITVGDLEGTNGVVHVIDRVLAP